MITKSKFSIINSIIFSIAIIGISSPTMAAKSEQLNLRITAEVPSICYADMDIADQKDNKVTMKMKRFCNAYHSIELSANIDDSPVEGLFATLKGRRVTEADGTLMLYKHSPPEIGQEKISLHLPPELTDTSEIVLSLTINPE